MSEQDRELWDRLFLDVPVEWKLAPPSEAMQTCASWLEALDVRDVLDVGCGIGRWAVWLSKRGFRVWGADLSSNAVAYARRWCAEEGLAIPVAACSVTERAFPELRFDAVIAALVFDLVSARELGQALAAAHDALRTDGHLFAVLNPEVEPPGQSDNPTAGVTVVRYSDKEIRQRADRAGFDFIRAAVLDEGTCGYLWRRRALRSEAQPGSRPDREQ